MLIHRSVQRLRPMRPMPYVEKLMRETPEREYWYPRVLDYVEDEDESILRAYDVHPCGPMRYIQHEIPYPFGSVGQVMYVKQSWDVVDNQVVLRPHARQARRMPRSAAKHWVRLVDWSIQPLEITNHMAHGITYHGDEIFNRETLSYNFFRNHGRRFPDNKELLAYLWCGEYELI